MKVPEKALLAATGSMGHFELIQFEHVGPSTQMVLVLQHQRSA